MCHGTCAAKTLCGAQPKHCGKQPTPRPSPSVLPAPSLSPTPTCTASALSALMPFAGPPVSCGSKASSARYSCSAACRRTCVCQQATGQRAMVRAAARHRRQAPHLGCSRDCSSSKVLDADNMACCHCCCCCCCCRATAQSVQSKRARMSRGRANTWREHQQGSQVCISRGRMGKRTHLWGG